MATIVKHGKKWQVRIRKKGHIPVYKSFISKHNASKWAQESERKIEAELLKCYLFISFIQYSYNFLKTSKSSTSLFS